MSSNSSVCFLPSLLCNEVSHNRVCCCSPFPSSMRVSLCCWLSPGPMDLVHLQGWMKMSMVTAMGASEHYIYKPTPSFWSIFFWLYSVTFQKMRQVTSETFTHFHLLPRGVSPCSLSQEITLPSWLASKSLKYSLSEKCVSKKIRKSPFLPILKKRKSHLNFNDGNISIVVFRIHFLWVYHPS